MLILVRPAQDLHQLSSSRRFHEILAELPWVGWGEDPPFALEAHAAEARLRIAVDTAELKGAPPLPIHP